MRLVSTALASLALVSGCLATVDDICPAGAVDAFTSNVCCPPIGPTRRRRLSARTGCTDGSCCDTKAPGPPVVSTGGTTDLQCGRNFDPATDTQDVPGGVTYTIAPCPDAGPYAGQTCLHVALTAAPDQTVSDIHLAILDGSGDPNSLPNGLGTWPHNGYCAFSGNTGTCDVPVSVVLAVLSPSSTTLCNQDIIVSAGISITGPTGGATCFNKGTQFGDTRGGRWFMYTTVSFTCPEICTHTCCCPPPPTPDIWCDIGTAFGYNAASAINFNGNPVGPALTANTCKRWGWYFYVPSSTLTSSTGLTGTLIVGAGGNDVSKGTPVGTFSATLGGTVLTVSYSLSSGFDLSEVHVYASCTKPASCAPGSYTYPKTGTVLDLSGTSDTQFSTAITVDTCSSYYLIFHAKVSQSFPAGTVCPGTVV